MKSLIQQQQDASLAAIKTASDAAALKEVRLHYLGKSGAISCLSEQMRTLSKEERPAIGQLLNQWRNSFTEVLEAKEKMLLDQADEASFASLDPSLPGTASWQGALHPLTLLTNRIVQIFRRLGFAIAEGPDIDDEWHCFDALNTPPDHPARQEQDTFYLPDGRLLRTHTSTVQIRAMEQTSPPLRIIAPGAAYRRDEIDATHLSQFTQMEVLCVGEGITLGDLKGTAEFFFRELFGPETECRFRPHFFPFTEPSFEIDVRVKPAFLASKCTPASLKAEFLKEEKWLELAGCGMVDPSVFEAVNQQRSDQAYDPEKISGFAFGFGLERLVMILTGISDIRMLSENDLRFLKRFAGEF
ncbi:MAG: phenylalanine--tRNA ligase subunit alpha [Verrucomicrobiae bacterium]|nr:phenylalanine--tRNA ligase subunit alpha [Verrucomicrobiae bacterium]